MQRKFEDYRNHPLDIARAYFTVFSRTEAFPIMLKSSLGNVLRFWRKLIVTYSLQGPRTVENETRYSGISNYFRLKFQVIINVLSLMFYIYIYPFVDRSSSCTKVNERSEALLHSIELRFTTKCSRCANRKVLSSQFMNSELLINLHVEITDKPLSPWVTDLNRPGGSTWLASTHFLSLA